MPNTMTLMKKDDCSDITLKNTLTVALTSSLLGAVRGAVAATASNLMGVVVSLKISETS